MRAFVCFYPGHLVFFSHTKWFLYSLKRPILLVTSSVPLGYFKLEDNMSLFSFFLRTQLYDHFVLTVELNDVDPSVPCSELR